MGSSGSATTPAATRWAASARSTRPRPTNRRTRASPRWDDGGFFVTWTSKNQDGDGNGVYGQQFDASGDKVGGETLINDSTAGEQDGAEVMVLGDGSVVVSWTSSDGGKGDSDSVFADYIELESTGQHHNDRRRRPRQLHRRQLWRHDQRRRRRRTSSKAPLAQTHSTAVLAQIPRPMRARTRP